MLFASSNFEWNGWIVCVCADKWLTDWLRTCVRACISNTLAALSAHNKMYCISFSIYQVCACSTERNGEKWIERQVARFASYRLFIRKTIRTELHIGQNVCVRESVRSVCEWKWYFLILVFCVFMTSYKFTLGTQNKCCTRMVSRKRDMTWFLWRKKNCKWIQFIDENYDEPEKFSHSR